MVLKTISRVYSVCDFSVSFFDLSGLGLGSPGYKRDVCLYDNDFSETAINSRVNHHDKKKVNIFLCKIT